MLLVNHYTLLSINVKHLNKKDNSLLSDAFSDHVIFDSSEKGGVWVTTINERRIESDSALIC